MTDSVTSPPAFRDAPARRRIADDLETNLLVEAGAGSGKTTELVNRMVALLASDTAKMGEIAAVTFTRKASAELRERFQAELEGKARAAAGGARPPPRCTSGSGPRFTTWIRRSSAPSTRFAGVS